MFLCLYVSYFFHILADKPMVESAVDKWVGTVEADEEKAIDLKNAVIIEKPTEDKAAGPAKGAIDKAANKIVKVGILYFYLRILLGHFVLGI